MSKKTSVLQINVTANSGSTGKIAEQINRVAQSQGWDTYIAYGRNMMPSKSKLIRVGNRFQVYEHYAEHIIYDNEGLASRIATKRFIRKIDTIKPDIIHIHNIHDHWLNYRILFEYLNTLHVPIIWTQHDCWSFTGGCAYFERIGCNQWRDGGCNNGCPMRHKSILRRIFEKTQKHYELKKKLFTATENLTIVPVSYWLEGLERQSFFKSHHIMTIHNGIDISTFQPTNFKEVHEKYGIANISYIIGVANQWPERKGFDDFIKLASLLPKDVKIVLVALNKEQVQIAQLHGIIGIPRTESVNELSALYSGAIMFCNLTYEDNYPTTNLEAMACGTPILTYRTGGSVEAVTNETGWIVDQGDIETVARIIKNWFISINNKPLQETNTRQKCRERAEREFNKDDRFQEYMHLYNELIIKK